MEIPEKLDSKFRFVLVAARRAEQIVRGAAPKLEHPHRKPTKTAMQEIQEDRIQWGYGPEPTAPGADGADGEEAVD